MPKTRYLLGDSPRERARLAAQARLWDPTAHALFDRIGVSRGWRVLELGPGRGSLHLELRRRVGGLIDAVEQSPVLAAALERRCQRDGFGPGRIWQTDVREVELPRAHYDLIFARWVLLFVPNAAATIRRLARALAPGGLLAIEEYHRETWALAPRPDEWFDFLAADRNFFEATGADVSLGSRLPALYRAAGLSAISTTPTIKTGAPGSGVWKWLFGYADSVIDRYARIPPMTPSKASRVMRDWRAAARQRGSLIIAPTMLDVVGQKN